MLGNDSEHKHPSSPACPLFLRFRPLIVGLPLYLLRETSDQIVAIYVYLGHLLGPCESWVKIEVINDQALSKYKVN